MRKNKADTINGVSVYLIYIFFLHLNQFHNFQNQHLSFAFSYKRLHAIQMKMIKLVNLYDETG